MGSGDDDSDGQAERGLWLAVIGQAAADACAADSEILVSNSPSAVANRPTAGERQDARELLTAPRNAAWRRTLAELAGLAPDALDRMGRVLALSGWVMTPELRALLKSQTPKAVELERRRRAEAGAAAVTQPPPAPPSARAAPHGLSLSA